MKREEINKNDILRILGIKHDKVYIGPKRIWLNLTNKCNLSCTFCWVHSPFLDSPKLHFKELDYRIIKYLINSCKYLNVEEVVLTGEGEPLLHSNFEEIVRYIKNKKIKLTITTNLSLRKNKIKCLKEVDVLYINLPAATYQTYKRLQPTHSEKVFNQIIQNIHFLAKDKHRPYLILVYLINKINFLEIEKLLLLATSLGIDEIDFRFMKATTDNEKIKGLLLSHREKEILKRNLEIIITASDSLHKIKNNLISLYKFLSNYEKSYFNLKRCYVGWFDLCVDLHGEVSFCFHRPIIFGNAIRNFLTTLWYSKEAHKVRLLYKYSLFKNNHHPECKYCHYFAEFNNKIEKIIK